MKVTVLLSSYNGERFINEQIDSLLKQQDVNLSIIVRDDGSTDSTKDILQQYQTEGKLQWYTGPNLKPAYSFLDLAKNAPDSDYYAFCDQDDVWEPDKIKTALDALEINHADLYYSAYTTTDSNLNILERNIQKPIIQTLGQAVVYASVTGCTMVFTKKLLSYLNRYKPQHIMMHDSWLFKIAKAMDLGIIYDAQSHILYRQHGNNVIGNEQSELSKWKHRKERLLTGTRKRYGEVLDLYIGYKDTMPARQLEQISPLVEYYTKSFFYRLSVANNKHYVTEVWKKNILFKIAVVLKIF